MDEREIEALWAAVDYLEACLEWDEAAEVRAQIAARTQED